MEPKESPGKESLGPKKKNLTFLRHKLYMLERRKTDTVLENGASTDLSNSGTLRRSQSDRTEYNQKLQEKMTPQNGPSAPATLTHEEQEQQIRKMMAKRSKIIKELIQTEKDYLNDLELCIREVVQPLRSKQIDRFDVDGLFSNIESVRQVSAKLLSMLENATTDVEPAMQVIGEVFLQIRGQLEDIYKTYCYQHDEAHTVLESYEKEEELKQHLRYCVQSLKKIYMEEGKPNLLDMGSLMIKPIQRVMKYPLLLCELRNSTPPSHPDYRALEEAFAAVKDINVNINELKRRKDLVLKYKKNDEDESLKEKFSKLNIHSISKKSKRVTNHLKILTRGESQVKDCTFNREEKLFRHLEKTVRGCVKNISFCLQHMKDAVSLAAQNVSELRDIAHDRDDQGYLDLLSNVPNPWEDFVDRFHRQVVTPLSALQALFAGPQKLIQKRYDKLLDYNSYRQRSAGAESDPAKRDYEALNAQLVEELQVFNRASRQILINRLACFITLLRDLTLLLLRPYPAPGLLPGQLISGICDAQHRVMEEIHELSFVKDNSATFIERKLSFEKKKPGPSLPEIPRQTDSHRGQLLTSYSPEGLFQAKRKCNASQDLDIDLLEGDLVAVVEKKDPLGSTCRWLVDTGITRGYVYSSFLKPYNPTKVPQAQAESRFSDDDFDDLSLFVSSRPAGDSAARTPEGSASENGSSLSGLSGKSGTDGTDAEGEQGADDQIFYAVHAFQARSDQELSLQEYQRVHILSFCDLSGNKEWWLAEAQGRTGYVPANYLGKMTYA
ncbi:rho guanine nucleotide exchange factor 38 [Ornithorhynchus anatinus]|uniref:Rho guanine nucleotide exchange factor 38 n=1 Tax=Ornithorhynchus anatinus TaxID=9258 RepID=F7ENG4_ORNAN|nr:rho guanine nucleotide exchange factor 38 [Ornithorhynchus anatinus]XP_028932176.1 rho guanine nucleotide exchange factor 38 [Ornithorhynchus anatinus]